MNRPEAEQNAFKTPESSLGKIGEHVLVGLEMGKIGLLLLAGMAKFPTEHDLMKGLSFEAGSRAVQAVLDDGLLNTENLYKGYYT